MVFRNFPKSFLSSFLMFALLSIFLVGCNEGSLEGGKGGEDEKDKEQVDPSKDLNAGDSQPDCIEEETCIARQPANVSGAFLTTKVIKVENQQVTMGTAVYVDGTLQHDINAMGAAGGVEMKWSPGSDVMKYVPIDPALQSTYTAIFELKYQDFETLNLSVQFGNYQISENKDTVVFAALTASACGPGECILSCNSETQFYNFSSKNTVKFTISDPTNVRIELQRISDCEYNANPHHVVGSYKVDVHRQDPYLPWIIASQKLESDKRSQGHIGFEEIMEGQCKATNAKTKDRVIGFYIMANRYKNINKLMPPMVGVQDWNPVPFPFKDAPCP